MIDKKTGEKSKTRPRFVKQDQIVIMRLECSGILCMETFKKFPQIGRFILRDEGMDNYYCYSNYYYLFSHIFANKRNE